MNYFIGGSKMTEQVKKEIIKAYAYGKTPQEAAAAMGVSLEPPAYLFANFLFFQYCRSGSLVKSGKKQKQPSG